MLKRIFYYVPILLIVALSVFFYFSLSNDTSKISSPIIGKPLPEFSLPSLLNGMPNVRSEELNQEGTFILNVWASWCVPCRAEHDILMVLNNLHDVTLYGLNYKDKPSEAIEFINILGNPFKNIGVDKSGRTAIDLGVYGLPETFIIRDGKVIYKHIGPIHMSELDEIILPILKDSL